MHVSKAELPAQVRTGYAATSIDELPSMWDGFAKLVRAGLEITRVRREHHGPSARLLDDVTRRVGLRPTGALRRAARRRVGDIEGERLPLDAEHLVRVDAGTDRVLSSGPDGLRVLCIGGVPGGIYEAPDWSSVAG